MSIIELFLIAVGLCFDTLAISLIGGACMKDVNLAKRLKVLFFFAFFQYFQRFGAAFGVFAMICSITGTWRS